MIDMLVRLYDLPESATFYQEVTEKGVTLRRARAFERMRELFLGLRERAPGVDCLSMGMSDDFELALRHGATLVRVGTALFGPRPAPRPG